MQNDPVSKSIRQLRTTANDAYTSRPDGMRGFVSSLYHEAVFIFGSLGTLIPALLLAVMAFVLLYSAAGMAMMAFAFLAGKCA